MSNHSLVSIIIIFLNTEKFLEAAIESVLAQSYGHWELLLVDDGSTDNGTHIAHRYATQYPQKIRYLEHPNHQNRGMSATRNLGIQHAQGEWIAFLDADDVWLPEKLEYQTGVMISQPEASMVYGNTLYWHSWTGRPGDRQLDHIPDLGVEPNALVRPPQLLQLYLNGKSAVPCTCSVLVRTDVIRRIGGFEESFRGMYEDQAFYAKICLTEHIFVSDRCLDQYRQHPESNCQVTLSAGKSRQVRVSFLSWLADYLTQQRIEDDQLWLTLRQEIWLISQPNLFPMSERIYSIIRWIKKWILRMEDYLLPDTIRSWLWRNKKNTHEI